MKTILTAAAGLAALTLGSAHAQFVSADAGIGTDGLRINGAFKVVERIAIRGGFAYLDYELDAEEYDGIEYEPKLDFSPFGAFVDIHPFMNGFTVTGGIYQGTKELGLDATPTGPVEIGDETFTPEEIGTITGAVDLGDSAPYAGIGWDGALYRRFPVGFVARAGVMFTGTPEVSLAASGGTLSDDPNFLAQLEEEERNLQDEVTDFELYPVLSIGVSVGF